MSNYPIVTIDSVFDHAVALNAQSKNYGFCCGGGMTGRFCGNGEVIDFANNRATSKPSEWKTSESQSVGLKNETGSTFANNGKCTGGSCLFYEGHPGFDFRARAGTLILAAADGVAHRPASASN